MIRLSTLKERVESFALKPNASAWLFLVAFIEASVFPLPPDVLLITLCVMNPRRSVTFASICAAGSFAGSLLGYSIGYMFFEAIGSKIVALFGFSGQFRVALEQYGENAWMTLIAAGFTPIPYSVFTIAAGFHLTVEPLTFALASLTGRLVRFLLVGGLFTVVGPPVKGYLDRHLAKLMLITGALFIVVLLALKGLL